MRNTIRQYVEEGMRNRRDRVIIYSMLVVIAVCVALTTFWFLRSNAEAEEVGCVHHTVCSYESCGYVEAVACGHDCEAEDCELIEAAVEGVACDHNCETEGCSEPCEHDCEADDSCAYREAQPAVYNCVHTHDDTCGYVKAVACGFNAENCELCSAETIDYALRAIVTAGRSWYYTGETMQFTVVSDYSNPNDDDGPVTVKIDLPSDVSVLRLTASTSPDYPASEGWYQLAITSDSGSEAKYAYYNNYGETGAVLCYTITPGETLEALIDLVYPNGTTDSGKVITLEPQIVGDQPTGKIFLYGDTTTALSEFGWDKVVKYRSSSSTSLGSLAGTTYYSPTYTITANNLNTDGVGDIYTAQYTVTDTITMNGVYFEYPDTYVAKTRISGSNTYLSFYEGTTLKASPVYINKLAGGNVTITMKAITEPSEREGYMKVTGFVITYTAVNPEPYTSDLGNFTANIGMSLSTANCYTVDKTLGYGEGTTDYTVAPQYIKNEVDFVAKSIFYGDHEGTDTESNHISESEADVTLRPSISSANTIAKAAFSSENGLDLLYSNDTGPTSAVSAVSVIESGDWVYYRIRYKNNYAVLDALCISDILITNSGTTTSAQTWFDSSTFELVGIKTYNADGMTYDNNGDWDGINRDYTVLTQENYPKASGYALNLPGRAAVAAYKMFYNVPTNAEIVIVYRVRAVEASVKGSSYNYTFATTGINDDYSYDREDFFLSASCYVSFVEDKASVTFTKTIVDESGEHTETDGESTVLIYKPGDEIVYSISITNRSKNAITIAKLLETWPSGGVKLVSMDGVPDGMTLNVHKYTTSNRIAFYTSDGETIYFPDTLAQADARYLILEGLEIGAGETITLTIRGEVTGDLEQTNTVTATYEDGSSSTSFIEYKTSYTSMTVDKKAYRVTQTEGGWDWNEAEKAAVGYEVGDMVRYSITVTNNSLSGEVIDLVRLSDYYDQAVFGSIGATPTEGKYGTSTGVVIVEYPNGTTKALSLIDNVWYENVADFKEGYLLNTATEGSVTTNSLWAVVTDAGLAGKGEGKLTFHIFFELTQEVYDSYIAANQSDGIVNRVYAEGFITASNPTIKLTSEDSVTILMTGDNSNQKAKVEKSVWAVIRGLTENSDGTWTIVSLTYPDEDGNINVQEGDYVLYNIQLSNLTTAGENTDMCVYAVYDDLPTGMEFVGFTSKGAVSNRSGSTILTTGGKNPISTAAENYFFLDVGATGTATQLVNANISYVDGIATAAIISGTSDYWSGYLAKATTASYMVLAKVTKNYNSYDNVGGYVVDGDVQTTSSFSTYGETGKLIVDNAQVGGPYYGAGIWKSAVSYREDSTRAWKSIANAAVTFSPDYHILWQIDIKNSEYSSSAFEAGEYTVTDILPKNFVYIPGTAKISGNGYSESLEPTITTLEDGRTQLSWSISASLGIGSTYTIQFATGWKTGEALVYSIYQNEASLTLDDGYPLSYVEHGERVDKDSNTITDYAQVSMLGTFATVSYKTIENIDSDSPYNGGYGEGQDSSPVIDAIAGDTIQYTLNIENQASYGVGTMKDLFIIDTLPHVGDTGVVNRSTFRNSAFAVNFPDTTAELGLKVYITSAATGSTVELNSSQYSYSFSKLKADLNEYDWLGQDGANTWSDSITGADTVRIAIDGGVNIANGDKIQVVFNAIVAGDTDDSKLPSNEDIAWNSFGYSYKIQGHNNTVSTTLYAEPIKVGVKVPHGTIEVGKTVTENGVEVETDTAAFTFQLLRKLEGETDWTAASGIYYTLTDADGSPVTDSSGSAMVYRTDASGEFTLMHGQKVTIYAPAGYFYKVTETQVPDGYTPVSDDYVTSSALAEGGKVTVNWVNDREQDKWDITLKKTDSDGVMLSGAEFLLEMLGEDGQTWTAIGEYSTDGSGLIKFLELTGGTYRITEIAAPDGYSKLEEPIILVLPYDEKSGNLPEGVTLVPDVGGDADFALTVINKAGYELPESGGIGKYPIVIIGAMLITTAGGPLIIKIKSRKRRSSKA